VVRRRVLVWIDLRAGDWLHEVPSWGTSLLLHGLVLLMLGLYIYARSGRASDEDRPGHFAAQLREDLTSLVDSDHAGDPFTTIQTDDPPSLSIEPAGPDVDTISQPAIPALSHFAPELAGPDLAPDRPEAQAIATKAARRLGTSGAVRGLATVLTRLHTEDMTAPFSGRDPATRAKLVRREGGTVRSEKAVEEGLGWISRHQRPDGGWSLNFHPQCQGQGCPPEASLESDTAATGLALLPLLGAGHIHTAKSRYQSHVRLGLGWLVNHQQENGDLFTGGGFTAHLYSHAIATMALCEAYGLSKDPALKAPAQRAINFIAQAQSEETGGWRYQPGQAGDTSVFGWQMFALRSARLAGLSVPRRVLRGCRDYLDSAASDTKKITYAYMPGRPATAVMTAEALLARQYLGWPRDFPPLVKGAGRIAVDLEESKERNIYYWYYATQLLHNMQNQDWKRWNVRVRDGLVAMQVSGDGCDRGSWDPNFPQPDRWAAGSGNRPSSAGRLFLTSLSVLTLEVYYRYLPLYRPTDGDPNKLDTGDETPSAAEPKKDAPAS
jgi:hypothetical protein